MILLLSHCIFGLRNGIKRFQMGDEVPLRNEYIDLTSSNTGSPLWPRIQGANSGLSLHFANPDGWAPPPTSRALYCPPRAHVVLVLWSITSNSPHYGCLTAFSGSESNVYILRVYQHIQSVSSGMNDFFPVMSDPMSLALRWNGAEMNVRYFSCPRHASTCWCEHVNF